MSSRRKFIGQMLGGTATLAASGLIPARSALGASDRVRLGLIGAGGRGQEILKRSEEHTSELQSLAYLVCRLLLEKKKKSTKRRKCHVRHRRGRGMLL